MKMSSDGCIAAVEVHLDSWAFWLVWGGEDIRVWRAQISEDDAQRADWAGRHVPERMCLT